MQRTQRMYPGASFVRNTTRGAPAGSSGGNGTTGSYAAPLGIGTICMLLAAMLLYTLPPTRPLNPSASA